MNSHHRTCVAVALSAGVALFLASTAASGQAAPYNPQWYQQSWQTFGPQPYFPSYMRQGSYAVGSPYGLPPWLGPGPAQAWHQWGGSFSSASSNLQDMGDYYSFQMSLPGVNPNDLTMRVEGRVLSIAVLSQGSQGSQQSGQWQTFYNNFQQAFTLPDGVDSSRMQSNFENGVLTVKLPKVMR